MARLCDVRRRGQAPLCVLSMLSLLDFVGTKQGQSYRTPPVEGCEHSGAERAGMQRPLLWSVRGPITMSVATSRKG